MNERRFEIYRQDADDFDRSWEEYKLEGIQQRPAENLGFQMRHVYEIFSQSIAAQLPHERIRRYLELLKDLGVANFMSSLNDSKTISLPIGESTIAIVGEATNSYMDTDSWLTAFFASVLTRDGNAINILSEVPESTFQQAALKPDLFDLAIVRASKGLFDPSANIAELLVESMEASDESNIEPQRLAYSWGILLPVSILYRFVVDGDADKKLSEMFAYALKEHKLYFSSKDKEFDTKGSVSLPLMAVAAMLHDHKAIQIACDSDLIARWLVEI